MSLPLTYKGRLPGVLCEATLPSQTVAPLRLDVAGFVGFAERGPLDEPVALEDFSQYQAVFGSDLPVARVEGKPVYAHLPEAVRAFFDNGGRRCYVVRVAGDGARPNRFHLPGMVGLDPVEGTFKRAVAPAAWVGRWSDDMSLVTQLRPLPLLATAYHPTTGTGSQPEIDLEVPVDLQIRTGDLLRARFDGPGEPLVLFVVAQTRSRGAAASRVSGLPVTAIAGQVFSFATKPLAQPLPAMVERLTPEGWEALPVEALRPGVPVQSRDGESYELYLSLNTVVEVGELLCITTAGGEKYLLAVRNREIREDTMAASPPGEPWLVVQGTQFWQMAPPPSGLGQLRQAELLGFDLYIWEGAETQERWPLLQFGEGPGQWSEILLPQIGASGLDPARSARLRRPEQSSYPPRPWLYLPLDMDELVGPGSLSRPVRESIELAKTGKDGLDRFDPVALFLDPRLAGFGLNSLLGEAERLLYLVSPPVKLVKLHSLLAIEEIGLIAIPDALHRAWPAPERTALPEPPPPLPPAPPPRDWSRFLACPKPVVPVPVKPDLCQLPYEVGLEPEANGLPEVRQLIAALPEMQLPSEYEPGPMLQVQQALITLCAARADTMAILGLPLHFKRRETLEWQRSLSASNAFRQGPSLSYAAVYHPWLTYREEVTPELSPLRAMPPDGGVCGVIAARELARGPWIAPANLSFQGMVGLEPFLSRDDWSALFNAQVNLVRPQPGRFTLLSAHTLSLDRQTAQLNVRRLLIYLRKLALQRGQSYVFEANNSAFRQRVQLSFERSLSALAGLGALAAYEVVTGDEINTPNDYDNGRFIIALKVAPTLPIEFITIRLLRSGEGLLEIVER